MISFNVKDKRIVEKVLEKVRLVIFAESLGGVESLITYPVAQTHSAIPEEIRQRIGVTDTLLRLSVGIEALVEYFQNNIPQIKVIRPEATYLAWLDCKIIAYIARRIKERYCLQLHHIWCKI